MTTKEILLKKKAQIEAEQQQLLANLNMRIGKLQLIDEQLAEIEALKAKPATSAKK